MKSEKVIYKYNDVFTSPHEGNIKTQVGEYIVYFSSTMNKKRFIKRYWENVDNMKYWINAYNLTTIDTDVLVIIRTYTAVEKRGFKIMYNGITYSSLEEMNLQIKPKGE